MPVACERCGGSGCICEAHPRRPFPHDACAGPGLPCPACQPKNERPQLPPDWISFESTRSKAPTRLPRPLEQIWTLTKTGRTKTCGLYFHGESYGWEVQVRDGDFVEYGERCLFHERALRLAGELRAELERDGWCLDATANRRNRG